MILHVEIGIRINYEGDSTINSDFTNDLNKNEARQFKKHYTS